MKTNYIQYMKSESKFNPSQLDFNKVDKVRDYVNYKNK